MVLSKWLINSILWHFKINVDINFLDKSVILGLAFCVFIGVQFANLCQRLLATRWNRNNQLALESFFMTVYVKHY